MALDDDIRILSAVRLFEGFTKEQLRLLAFGAENHRIGGGREIYREGEPADFAYIVTAGRVRLYRSGEGGAVPIGAIGPGAMLGELGLIAETTRLTSAVTETDTDVMRLNRKMFHRILEEFPDVAVMLHQRIAAEFQALVARIEQLAPRFG